MKVRWLDESMLTISGDTATVRREASSPEGSISSPLGSTQQSRDASRPAFDSKLEAAYDQYLSALKHAGEIQAFWYHPLTLKLPGGIRYTPDFMVWPNDGKVQIHECKGSLKMKNARDGITRLKIAAGVFRCFDFRLVMRSRGKWEVSTI